MSTALKKNSTSPDAISNAGMSAARNSAQNLNYYDDLVSFFQQDDCSDLLKLRSFALYTPRQVISDFLVRYELMKMIQDIPGSIVELGVFNGQGLMSFAQISAILEPNHVQRNIYGFDTFEGFPDIDQRDLKGEEGRVKKGGLKMDSHARLTEAISLFDRNRFIGHVPKVKLVKGDVSQIMDSFLEENAHLLISLLYFDFDLYKPTAIALEKLLPRVPKGGIVAFDELNFAEFPGETQALIEKVGLENIALKRLPFCSRISYFVR